MLSKTLAAAAIATVAVAGAAQARGHIRIVGSSTVFPFATKMAEPCSALDPLATARVEEFMEEPQENYTIVIVTHNMQQAIRRKSPGLHHRALRLIPGPVRRGKSP